MLPTDPSSCERDGRSNRSFSSPAQSMPMTSGMDSLAPVQLPDDIQRRVNVYKGAGALLLIAVWGWFALVKGDQTPFFVYLNIAVHEVGHVLFRPFGELTMLEHDPASRSCSPSRSARSSCSSSVTSVHGHRLGMGGERPGQRGQLHRRRGRRSACAPGATGPDAAGDWERTLGVEFFDKVYLADRIAGTVRTLGFVLWGVALSLALGRSSGTRSSCGRPKRTRRPG